MAVITVGGIKGGVGKTTIATHLAVMRSLDGYDVLLIDGDDQESATDFSAVRAEMKGSTGYTAIQLMGANLRTQGLKLLPKYHDVIIDAGGRDTTSQRAALTLSDLALLPFNPRSFDLWTLGKVVQLMQDCQIVNPNLKIMTFLNKADSTGQDNSDAADALKAIETFHYIDASLGARKAFANAASDGCSVLEQKPIDKKAVDEIKTLYRHIFSI